MKQKKRPILTVFVILGIVGLFLVTTMVVVLKMLDPAADLSFGEKIGVIPIEGAIMDSRIITTEITKLRKDDEIRAIILRINSPGGAVGSTQEIYREVLRTTETKTVVASLGDVAASGGYYVAAAANRIVANPGTITGSIGVLMQFMRFQELLDKIGVQFEVLKSGEFKDVGSPHRELTEQERELINKLIQDIESQFVAEVANGRDLPLETVREVADGRIFSGAQALRLGLVDKLGNFHDAVELTKEIARIDGEVTLVYPKKSKPSLWDFILNRTAVTLTDWLYRRGTSVEYRWDGFPEAVIRENY
jgi:protease-4